MAFVPGCFGLILVGSSMIPNTLFADDLAFERDGNWDIDTPEPIDPTNTT